VFFSHSSHTSKVQKSYAGSYIEETCECFDVRLTLMESRTQMARPRTYSINLKVCAMATFPYGGTSCQRARAGTPGLWQKRITSVVTTRQDGNELTLITVLARIIRTFFTAVSVHLCVIENFTRPRPRPMTSKCVLKDPRGQGHVLEDSITGVWICRINEYWTIKSLF